MTAFTPQTPAASRPPAGAGPGPDAPRAVARGPGKPGRGDPPVSFRPGPDFPPGDAATEGAAATPGREQAPGRTAGGEQEPCVPGSQPRSWTIELPPGTPILTANDRLNRYAAQREINRLKGVAIQVARRARLPAISRAAVLLTYAPPPRLVRYRHPLASQRIEDSENLQPTAKALVDGLVKAGVFPAGDSRKHVAWVNCVLLPEVHLRGLLTLIITEIDP